MYIFAMLVLIFFAVIGITAFITAAGDALYRTKRGFFLVLPALDADNAEARVREAARLCKRKPGLRLICVCAKGDDAAAICERLKQEYPFITVKSEVYFDSGKEP